jgi:hypothetical protein
VACPLTVIADCMEVPLHLWSSNTSSRLGDQ